MPVIATDWSGHVDFLYKDVEVWADASNQYDKLYSEMIESERATVQKAFNSSKSEYNKNYLNPLKVKLEAANRNYKKQTGGLDYTGVLFNRNRNVSNVNLTLPSPIIKEINDFAKDRAFASLNQKDIKGIYDRLLLMKEGYDAKGQDYRQDAKFMQQLQDFEFYFDEINLNISKNEQAKKNKFISINSVDAYKDIDIKKIKALLD